MTAAIEVRGLRVMPRGAGSRLILRGIDFDVHAGECLAVIGESGAGKSTALKAVCGLLPPCLRAEGEVRLHGEEVLHLGYRRRDRGRRILYLSQQPMTAFDPLVRLGRQLEETLRAHRPVLSRRDARSEIASALASLRFADPEAALERYPCELSGGMLQRMMTAAALLLKPEIVVADEPTSALDVLSVREVRRSLERIRAETHASLVIVTHDLGFAESLADRFIVMKAGEIVEAGGPKVLAAPKTPYVQHLAGMRRKMEAALAKSLEAKPAAEGSASGASATAEALEASAASAAEPPLLLAKGLVKRYAAPRQPLFGPRRLSTVLEGAALSLRPGEAVGLVGPSGAGKSTLARLLLGLEAPDAGTLLASGEPLVRWRAAHPGAASLISQNYAESADPAWTVDEIVAEPIRLAMRRAAPEKRAALTGELSRAALAKRLADVGLPEAMLDRRPHELSGGELQRICIARALAASPQLVVFDEALSSLDASVQGEIIELLQKMPRHDAAWLFISHDLRAVAALCTRVLFLSNGRIVESADAKRLGAVKTPEARVLVEAAAAR